jgi:hypothetical protein
MLKKVSGLARTLYIVIAIVAGFVALGAMLGGVDLALVLLVLGLIAGITMPDDRVVVSAVTVVALPIIGAALTHVPTIGAQLSAVAGNLQIGVAGAVATAIVIRLYGLTVEGVTGLTAASK